MNPLTPTDDVTVIPTVRTEVNGSLAPEVQTTPAPDFQARLQEWRNTAEEYARREPVKAIAIALVAGIIVGKAIHLLFGSRRRKEEHVERVIIRSPRDLKEWPA
jgi:hypothetical protein